MKAIVLKNHSPIDQHPLVLSQMPVPQPVDNQILIKVSVCGVCHTDLDIIEGRLIPPALPRVLGHQVVGTVAQIGKSVSALNLGQRVGVTWLYSACGKCSFCKAGMENLCPTAKWTSKDADGGYAEYMVIGENYAYPIPPFFTDSQAAPLLCAGVIGYRALRLAQISDGQTIGLWGFGACAHIVIQVIKYKFPNSKIFVFTKTDEHKKLALKLGADWVGNSADTPPAPVFKALDFTPVGECIKDALAALDKGGRLIINAIRKETPIPPLDYAKYLWLEKEIKSVANVTKADATEFLSLAAQIPIVPKVQEFPLEQANEALIALKHSQINGAAVLRIQS